MKMIINGHAQHGKDYLAAAVAQELGMRHLTASMWFAEKHMMPAFPGKWSCVEEAFQDRKNRRTLWYEMMRVDAPNWQLDFMEHSDIFTGHRSVSEHNQMRQAMGDGVLSIFVEWKGRIWENPASCEWQDENTIADHHDMWLTHNGHGTERMIRRIQEKING